LTINFIEHFHNLFVLLLYLFMNYPKVQENLKLFVVTILSIIFSLLLISFNTKLFAQSEPPTSSTGVIVDDSDGPPSFVYDGQTDGAQDAFLGSVPVGYNEGAVWTGNSRNTTPHNWGTWTASGVTGELEVFATIPNAQPIYEDSNDFIIVPVTHAATYVITHAGGQTSITIDQQASMGGKVSLGTYTFAGTGSVYLDDVVAELGEDFTAAVFFDAISFGDAFGDLDLTPPLIEDVIASTYEEGGIGKFTIQAKVTDIGSGVATVTLTLKRADGTLIVVPMISSGGDTYYATVEGINIGENIYYEIEAVDNVGLAGFWTKDRGYVSRGRFGRRTGLPRWAMANTKKYLNNAPAALNAKDNQCNPCINDPINTATGNLVDMVKVVLVPGRPMIDLHLTYNSQGGTVGVFGENWTHNFEYHLLEMTNPDQEGAFVQYPDGQVVFFAGSDFVADPGIYEKLTKNGDTYELLFKDLTKVIFDNKGEITRWEDANGNGINFSYGERLDYTTLSQITSMKADGGREITLEYNDKGLVSKVNAPEGKTVNFEYNDTDDLIKIIDARGNPLTYEYDDHKITKKLSQKGHPFMINQFDGERKVTNQVAGSTFLANIQYSGNVVTVTDNNNLTNTYEYNSDLLVTKLTDANGKSLLYEYDSNKNVTSFTDRDGNEYTYEYDANGNQIKETDPAGNVTEREFDSTFNKVTKEVYKQSDHVTNYEYDSKGNLTKVTNANGDSAEFEYNGFGQLVKSTDFNNNPTEYSYSGPGDLATIKDAKGFTQTFNHDGLGRLISFINARGFSYGYAYDLNDNLTNITGALGYVLNFEYDANNHLVKEIDANGGVTSYEYDASENLTKVTNQLGFSTSFTYGLMNEKLSEIDAEGRITQLSYDPIYNIAQIKEAAGTSDEAITAFAYNASSQVTSITDPEGRITQLNLDLLHRTATEIQNANGNSADSENNVETDYEYTPTGQISKITDGNGNETNYTYDKLDRLIKVEDAEGHITDYEYDAQSNLTAIVNPRGFVTEYEYDELNRISRIIDAKNGVTEFSYDKNGNVTHVKDANGIVTKFAYNELDRMFEKLQNFIGGGAVNEETNVRTVYEYDLHGNLVKVINPRGFATVYNYDAAHRNTSIVDAVGSTTNLSYDRVNNLLQIVDRNGHVYTNQYDNLNRIIKSTNPESHFESYSYDKVGNLIQYVNARGKIFSNQYDPLNRVKIATDPYLKTQISSYDPVGNLLSFTDENGHTDYSEYDDIYRLTKATDAEGFNTNFEYDQNSNLTKLIDGNGNETKYSYDELDRLIDRTNAENEVEKYEYDAIESLLKRIEADGTQHKFEYDPLYRLVSVVDNYKSGENANDDTNISQLYNYDENGNLVKQTDALNRATNFEYNELDRLVREINALNNNWQYGYDPEGNMTSRIDANGATTNYGYYPDNELQKIQYPTYSVDYSYSETNYPVQMTDNLGVTGWSYDDLDRLTSQADPLTRNINYAYDFVGNLTNLGYPDGRFVEHSYLKNDWLKRSVSSDNDEVLYSRDGVGNTTELERSNSSTSKISYDKVYRPLKVEDRQIGNGNHLISKFQYQYNDVGHITKENADYGWRQPSNVVTDYSYDGMHRLVRSKSTDKEDTKYNYNAVGNRMKMEEYIPAKNKYEVRDYSYNEINSLMNINIKSPTPPNNVVHDYKYDKNGNRIDHLVKDGTGEDRGTQYSFDVENRLLSAQDYQGQIVQMNGMTGFIRGVKNQNNDNTLLNQLAHTDMQYDGNGRRLVETYFPGASQPGKRTEFTFDRLDPIVESYMWNGQRLNLYRDSNLDLQFYQEFKSEQAPSGTLYWYHHDGEGNVVATTKHQAQSDHTYRYDEYGWSMDASNVSGRNNTSGNNGNDGGNFTAPHNDYTLSQKSYDVHLQMHYFGSRYYEPSTGTWLTQDSYRGEIQNPMSLHRYMYNYQSPVNYEDWYGYCIEPASFIGCVAAGALIAWTLADPAHVGEEVKNPQDFNNFESPNTTTPTPVVISGTIVTSYFAVKTGGILAPAAGYSPAVGYSVPLIGGATNSLSYVATNTLSNQPVSFNGTVANFGGGTINSLSMFNNSYDPFFVGGALNVAGNYTTNRLIQVDDNIPYDRTTFATDFAVGGILNEYGDLVSLPRGRRPIYFNSALSGQGSWSRYFWKKSLVDNFNSQNVTLFMNGSYYPNYSSQQQLVCPPLSVVSPAPQPVMGNNYSGSNYASLHPSIVNNLSETQVKSSSATINYSSR
jgi:RHS repeat-associated protein